MSVVDALPKSVFLALAAVGWADGVLDDDEARALVRAAEAHGVSAADVTELRERMRTPVVLGDIDRTTLTPWQRLLAYALATWISHVDGVVTTGEQQILDRLGVALDLPFSIRRRAEDAAVSAAHGDTCPDKYDFGALAKVLRERLPHLAC
jgi:uncharacterized membrane protein YebE (DUF533 family)